MSIAVWICFMLGKIRCPFCLLFLKPEKEIESPNKQGKQETYRNSIKPFIELLQKIKNQNLLKHEHRKYLLQLPFSNLINMLYKDVISLPETMKNSTTIDIFIKKYDKDSNCFLLGPHRLQLKEADIAIILGVENRGQMIQTTGHLDKDEKENKGFKDFLRRHFHKDKFIKKKQIETALFVAIIGTSEEDLKDTARLLLLYLAATFLVSNANSNVPWILVPYCIHFNKFKEISWPKTILKQLMDQVIKYHQKDPRKIHGCVTILLWWLCEKTKVLKNINPKYKETYPPAGKWNISNLKPTLLLDMEQMAEKPRAVSNIGKDEIRRPKVQYVKERIQKDDNEIKLYKEREEKHLKMIKKLRTENKSLKLKVKNLEDEIILLKKKPSSPESENKISDIGSSSENEENENISDKFEVSTRVNEEDEDQQDAEESSDNAATNDEEKDVEDDESEKEHKDGGDDDDDDDDDDYDDDDDDDDDDANKTSKLGEEEPEKEKEKSDDDDEQSNNAEETGINASIDDVVNKVVESIQKEQEVSTVAKFLEKSAREEVNDDVLVSEIEGRETIEKDKNEIPAASMLEESEKESENAKNDEDKMNEDQLQMSKAAIILDEAETKKQKETNVEETNVEDIMNEDQLQINVEDNLLVNVKEIEINEAQKLAEFSSKHSQVVDAGENIGEQVIIEKKSSEENIIDQPTIENKTVEEENITKKYSEEPILDQPTNIDDPMAENQEKNEEQMRKSEMERAKISIGSKRPISYPNIQPGHQIESKKQKAVSIDNEPPVFTQIDFENVPRSIELKGDIKIDVTKIPSVKFLTRKQLQVLMDFFNNNNLSNSAYSNFQDDIFLQGTILGDLLIGRFLDSQIIDWFSIHMTKKRPNNGYFKTYAALFIENGSKENIEAFVDKKINQIWENYEKMFFPIFAKSHFTLLEFQKTNRSWIHYDSIKPKNLRGDEHLRIARKVRIYVSAFLKKLEGKQHVPSKLVVSADGPQQPSSSVDCGLYVISLMVDRTLDKKVQGNIDMYTPETMLHLRSGLVHKVLADETFSWNCKFNESQEYSENVLPNKETDPIYKKML